MFRNINMDAFRSFENLHVPATGGLDIVSPKTLVTPGTLMECLNYEVVAEPGYKQCDGILQYVGKGEDVPKRYLKANIAGTLNPGSFIIGGIYPLGIIGVLSVDVIAKVVYLGTISEGPLEINYAYFVIVEGDLTETKDALTGDLMIFIPPAVISE